MMTKVLDHVSGRAIATPRMTAARYGDHAVSYGELNKTIHDYQEVLSRHGLGDSAAVAAGIMAALPTVATGDSVAEVVEWLGRDIDSGLDLRAVS